MTSLTKNQLERLVRLISNFESSDHRTYFTVGEKNVIDIYYWSYGISRTQSVDLVPLYSDVEMYERK